MTHRRLLCTATLVLAVLLVLGTRSTVADPAKVLSVKAYAQSFDANPGWNLVLEIQHRERMRDTKHFCDKARVATPDGKTLKEAKFKYGRGGRPYKDRIPGVRVPTGVAKLIVEAHCKQDGWGDRKVEIDLSQPKGEDYELIRDEELKQHIQTLLEACRAKSTKDMKGLLAAKASREELAMIGHVSVPQLLEAVKDDNWVVRWSAMDVLAKVGTRKEALEPILTLYDDPNGTLRTVAVMTCARWLSDPRVQEATFAKMESGRGGEKKYAAKGLLRNRQTKAKAMALLKEQLAHKSAGVRASAFTILKEAKVNLREEAFAILKTQKDVKLLSLAMEYVKETKDARSEVVEALKAQLKASAPQTRGEALLALFGVAPTEAYEHGIATLETEKDGKARRFMLGKLFKCQAADNRLIEQCIQGLRDEEIKTRSLCVKALQYFAKQKLGFYPDALPDYREKQAKRWDEWWAKNKTTFKLTPIPVKGGRRR